MTTTSERPFDMGGRRNYNALPKAEKDAVDFISWAIEEGHRRETGARRDYAAHAARHLRKTDPRRYLMAIASRDSGRTDAVYAALVAMTEAVAQ